MNDDGCAMRVHATTFSQYNPVHSIRVRNTAPTLHCMCGCVWGVCGMVSVCERWHVVVGVVATICTYLSLCVYFSVYAFRCLLRVCIQYVQQFSHSSYFWALRTGGWICALYGDVFWYNIIVWVRRGAAICSTVLLQSSYIFRYCILYGFGMVYEMRYVWVVVRWNVNVDSCCCCFVCLKTTEGSAVAMARNCTIYISMWVLYYCVCVNILFCGVIHTYMARKSIGTWHYLIFNIF